MIHTRICDLLGITHPVVLGGMGTGTSAALVAAVSNAGGFGTIGTSGLSGEKITAASSARACWPPWNRRSTRTSSRRS